MWRVLAAMDFITVVEAHMGVTLPAAGISTGFHFAVGAFAWKFDRQCWLGPIPTNSPPCLGHDAGVLRPHVMIDPTPPPPASSAITSLQCTANSALKPTFSASRDLRNGGGALPVSAEALPYGAGIVFSGNVPCGFGGPHVGIPMIPTQMLDWTGLTLGDIIGGLVNMQLETLSQACLDLVSSVPGLEALPYIVAWGPALGISVWPSGHAAVAPVQQAIDGLVANANSNSSASAPSSSAGPSSAAPSSGAPASGSSSSAGASSAASGSAGAGPSGASPSGAAAAAPPPPSDATSGWSAFGDSG